MQIPSAHFLPFPRKSDAIQIADERAVPRRARPRRSPFPGRCGSPFRSLRARKSQSDPNALPPRRRPPPPRARSPALVRIRDKQVRKRVRLPGIRPIAQKNQPNDHLVRADRVRGGIAPLDVCFRAHICRASHEPLGLARKFRAYVEVRQVHFPERNHAGSLVRSARGSSSNAAVSAGKISPSASTDSTPANLTFLQRNDRQSHLSLV